MARLVQPRRSLSSHERSNQGCAALASFSARPRSEGWHPLNPVGTGAVATAMSHDGSVIVGIYLEDPQGSSNVGFVWSASSGMLTQPLPGINATGVSGDGSIVVDGTKDLKRIWMAKIPPPTP